MKKLASVILALMLVFTAFSFAETPSYKIGICNFVDDASLNQIIENIRLQLADIEAATGVKFEIYEDNCNTDAALMSQIIANFINDDVDLMVAIATPVAIAMQGATEDNGIPVIFAAVSDPLSVGLVDTLETPGANITGTSDFLNTEAVLNLIIAANPEIKSVGLLYDLGQDSSTTPIAAAKAFLDEKGIGYYEYNGTNTAEVIMAAQSAAADKVEAVFTPTDNTIMAAELSIYEIFAEAGIPHYCGADSFALNGSFVGYGVDYANLGRETANMIKSVLVDGIAPAELSVMTFDNGTATVNTETCAAIGFDYETIAAAFAPYCTQVQTIVTADSF